jgi:hypothetical protein
VSSEATQFKPGQPSRGGRRKGSRDRIATAMLEAIAKDFEEHGEEAIKICRIERPTEYLKVVAALLPKEFEASIDQNVEVVHQIEHIRRTIIDPKAVTVMQPVRLIKQEPALEPEPKADLGHLYE